MEPVNPDISVAKTLDTAFYNDASYLELAKDRIFAPSWQYVGDISMLTGPGSCQPLTLLPGYLDEPLVLTKDDNQNIHCLSNVCTHRGNIVISEACTTPHLRCKYHGRVFRLDGSFKSMPEFSEVKNFPSKDDNMPGLALKQWGPLLFTTLEYIHTFESFFGAM